MYDKTIDDYLSLSVADCKRLGYFVPRATCSGSIGWTRNGRTIASVGFATKTTGVPMARFSYEYNGRPVTYDVALRWKRSNLTHDSAGGYYYFVCPSTGQLCRKLYLVNGRFVSREAFRPLYPQQMLSRKQREEQKVWRAFLNADGLVYQRFRRETYRGRLTPYGRKVGKLARLLDESTTTAAN